MHAAYIPVDPNAAAMAQIPPATATIRLNLNSIIIYFVSICFHIFFVLVFFKCSISNKKVF